MHALLQDWFITTLASTVAIGVLMALFKLPSIRNINKYQLTTYSSGLAMIFSLVFAFWSIQMNMSIIWASFLWAFFYLATTIAQMKSLEYVESSSLFPFTSLLSNIFVILIWVFFWQDHISLIQGGAMATACLIFALHSYKGKIHLHAVVIPLFLFIASSSTVAKNFQKYGSVSGMDNLINFVFWQMAALFILSFLLGLTRGKEKLSPVNMNLKSWWFVALFWFLQFLASILMVMGLSHGPISLVYVINGFYTFITVGTCVIFFGEKITKKQLVLMILAFLTILTIKIG